MPPAERPQLHLVIGLDRPIAVVEAAATHGVDWIQIRDHQATAGDLYAFTREVIAICRPRGVRVAVNDRLDVALAAGADAVQLGGRGLPIAVARGLCEWACYLSTGPGLPHPLAPAPSEMARGKVRRSAPASRSGSPLHLRWRGAGGEATRPGHESIPGRQAAAKERPHPNPLPKGEGMRLLLGASVHDPTTAQAAASDSVDWLTFGHVFPTASHPGEPPRGTAALAEIVAAVTIPVIAIGGIDRDNVAQVLETGAAGIAVISAIANAPDPGMATAALRRALDRFSQNPGTW